MDLGKLFATLELDPGPFQKGLDSAGKKTTSWSKNTTKVLAGAGVAAGAAFAGALVKGIGIEKSRDRLAASLGLTGKEAARAGKIAGNLYAAAYGDSLEEVNTATAAVMTSIKGMATAPAADVETLTGRLLSMSTALELDVTRAAQVAGQMITNGLAKDGTEALDLLTTSMQSVPVAVREDILDAADEYGPFFKQLGIGGEQAFAMLVKGAEQGMYGIDKTGDALKELTIRAADGSKATVGTLEAIGLNAGETATAMTLGGDAARAATGKIIDGLLGIKDPAQQSQAAIALFGTPLEDLGATQLPAFLKGMRDAGGGLGDFEGSAAQLDETLNGNLATSLTELGRSVMAEIVTPVLEHVIPALGRVVRVFVDEWKPALVDAVGWLELNRDMLTKVAKGVGIFGAVLAALGMVGWIASLGGMSGAFGLMTAKVAAATAAIVAHNIVQGAMRVASLASAAAMGIFNLVLAANPIVLVVGLLVLFGVAMWALATKTETGRKVISAAWSGIKKAVSVVADWFRYDVVRFFTTAWSKITGAGRSARIGIDGIMTSIKAAFSNTVTAIGKGWDGLKSKMSRPVRWVADTVVNPLIGAYNKIAGVVGISKLSTWNFKGFKVGGRTGPDIGVDSVAGFVHGQEFVLNKQATDGVDRQAPGLLEYINETGKLPLDLAGAGYKSGGRVVPVNGPMSGSYAGHSGIDYAVPTGTTVRAAGAGRVSYTGTGRGYGRAVFQSFADGGQAVYGHLLRYLVGAGSSVGAGQPIALSDNTGRSTGPHLHFEVTGGGGFGASGNRATTFNWLKGASAGGGGGLFDWLKNKFGGFLDPMKWLAKLAAPLLGKLTSVGGGQFGKIIAGLPRNILKGMSSFVADKFGLGGYATGTRSALPGIRDIGENGAELVLGRQQRNFLGGEQVLPLKNLGGDTYHIDRVSIDATIDVRDLEEARHVGDLFDSLGLASRLTTERV